VFGLELGERRLDVHGRHTVDAVVVVGGHDVVDGKNHLRRRHGFHHLGRFVKAYFNGKSISVD
jgi:hypothetical protein